MEKLSLDSQHEQKERPQADFCAPLVDVLRSARQAGEIWPEIADELRPQIEKHAENADKIVAYLDDFERGEATIVEKNRFYEGVCNLLDNPEQERIALFLPFESFPTPKEHSYEAERFRESYLSAWGNLLNVQDVRASFVDGDVLEVDARPGDPERVVKAAHLAPWLAQSGLLKSDDIISLAQDGGDELLTRSLLETKNLLSDLNLLSEAELAALENIENNLPEKSPTGAPKYITIARRTWLAEKARGFARPVHAPSETSLSQPLSGRLLELGIEIDVAKQLADGLDPSWSYNVVWLGGSRLKGYSQDSSDLDLYVPVKRPISANNGLQTIPVTEIERDLPGYAHEVFDMAWIGEPDKIQQLQRQIVPQYFFEKDPLVRRRSLERLEQDLLEYRLLHKGYPRLHPDTNPEYKKYLSMDGQSAFYERGYRIIATKIFANSVFIPRI